MGEYLGRVYDEVRSRPLSIINRVYQGEQVFASTGRADRGIDLADSNDQEINLTDTSADSMYPAA
jgi:hypothetical protein